MLACIAPFAATIGSGPVLFVRVKCQSRLLRNLLNIVFFSQAIILRSLHKQDAVKEYVDLMKTQAGVDKVPVVTVEEDPAKCLSASW